MSLTTLAAGTGNINVAPFDNSYARLPERFYARLAPTPVKSPTLIRLNTNLAEILGIASNVLSSPSGVDVLAGNTVPTGADPLAMAYAGHQFGGWVPQLGDGRAILLGEVIGKDGIRRDIQLKGCGRTPFSTTGDGRAPLGPILREYIVSEAMHALDIPTTRSLAAVTTGETVLREGYLPGAVLTRVARSHIRVGTFQFFAARGDTEAIQALADHVVLRHYPEIAEIDKPYLALLDAVLERQVHLIARWLQVGFIHGVMNTDNTSIVGDTIDYGPCAFMDTYDPKTVFSSIDWMGRYAYANQPIIGQWNLARFAQCLLPIMDEDRDNALADAQTVINSFPKRFEVALAAGYRNKLGLLEQRDGDAELAQDLLECMATNDADFTRTFRALANLVGPQDEPNQNPRNLFNKPEDFDHWARQWQARLNEEPASGADHARVMRLANPAIIPRNHLVEEAIRAAEDHADFDPFQRLVDVLTHPCDEPDDHRYTLPPRPDQVVRHTFCGT